MKILVLFILNFIHLKAKCIKFSLNKEPVSLDPLFTYDEYTFNITSNLFEPIISMGKDGKISQGLAKNWKILDNKIIFDILDSKWSNGDLVTAMDIYKSFQRILKPNSESKYVNLLYNIKNAERYNKGYISDFKNVGIKVINEHQIEIEFLYINQDMMKTMAIPLSFITFTPVKVIKKKMLFSGPFKLIKWYKGDRIELESNSYYTKGKKNIKIKAIFVNDELTAINLFRNNFLDIVLNVSYESVEKNKELLNSLTEFDKMSLIFLNFNCNRLEKEVRKRIALSLDREEISKNVLKGTTPAFSIIPETFPGNNYYKILKEEKIQEKIDMTLNLICSNSIFEQKLAQYIKEKLYKQLNIKINIHSLSNIMKIEKLKSKDFDISINSWIADYFGPPYTFMEIFKSNSENNYSQWVSLKYEDIYEKSLKAFSIKDKYYYLKEAEELVVKEEFPVTPLVFNKGYYLINNKIKNFIRGVSSRNPNFTNSFKE